MYDPNDPDEKWMVIKSKDAKKRQEWANTIKVAKWRATRAVQKERKLLKLKQKKKKRSSCLEEKLLNKSCQMDERKRPTGATTTNTYLLRRIYT